MQHLFIHPYSPYESEINSCSMIQSPQFLCSSIRDLSAASARVSASSSLSVSVLICSSYASLFCNLPEDAAVVVAAAVVLQSQFAHGSAVVVVGALVVVSVEGAGRQEEPRWRHRQSTRRVFMVRMD